MKTMILAAMLAASAFGEATVKYERTAPNCSPSMNWAERAQSGCFWNHVTVTASSTRPEVNGFMVVMDYKDPYGLPMAITMYTFSKNADGAFVVQFNDPGAAVTISALELTTGELVSVQ